MYLLSSTRLQLTAILYTAVVATTAQATPMFTESSFAQIRFLEGKWKGVGPDGKEFFEEYVLAEPSLFRSIRHADPSFTLKVYTHVYDDQRTAAALTMSELLAAPGRTDSPRPASATEWAQGRDALERLHAALGEFLTTAPEWARAYVGVASR